MPTKYRKYVTNIQTKFGQHGGDENFVGQAGRTPLERRPGTHNIKLTLVKSSMTLPKRIDVDLGPLMCLMEVR